MKAHRFRNQCQEIGVRFRLRVRG